MRYYAARQRVDGKWEFACGNYPVGYCAGYKELTEKECFLSEKMLEEENAKIALNKDKYHRCGHDTKEEAQICYKNYLLDNRIRFEPEQKDPSQLFKCRVCGKFCSGYAISEYDLFSLCEEHCNRESLSKIMNPPQELWIS
jgi:hypothetical protein